MTDLLRSDYAYPRICVSFTQVLFWLINRGSFLFTPVFYGSPSEELRNACSSPVQETLEVLCKPLEARSNVEYVYYLSDLFQSLYKDLSLNPAFFDEFVDDLSGYVNIDGTVNDDDFITEFYDLLNGSGEGEEQSEEISVKIDIFCDVFLNLFHEDESSESVDFVYIVTLMSLLLFLVSKDVKEATSLLLSYLVDPNNQNVIPRASVKLFLHCITWLMIEMNVNPQKQEQERTEEFLADLSVSPELSEKKEKIVENLMDCVVLFASPSHFQNPALREKIEEEVSGQDGIHCTVENLLIEQIFMGIMQRWSYEQVVDCLMQLFQVPSLDALLEDSLLYPVPVKEVEQEVKEIEVESETLFSSDSSDSSDHIHLFSTNSSIGLALHVPLSSEI